MNPVRSLLLAASQNRWLRERAPKYRFVRRTVSRFMPGEELEDALAAIGALREQGLGAVLTYLGENISDREEANQVTARYLEALDAISARELETEISIKLTHLGLDLSAELCYENLQKLIERAGPESTVWIDMESSDYVDRTLELFRRARLAHPNVGVCLQAYLYRTADDLAGLIPAGAAIRLVKGAYREPPGFAFPRKRDVDENFFALACKLLGDEARKAGVRAAIATHDRELIARTIRFAETSGLGKEDFEFQMLFGIQRAEQQRLAREGYRSIVFVAYGDYWYPWFMRRLAERPANLFFTLRNLFAD
ncbi:MAG: proline dehydrogenase family protein [Blastocatellia bacterium]|nr:proline dehydrogenase family protein [Blastocatellia bacterium]